MAGTTELNTRLAPNGEIEANFKGRNGGASNWTELVDAIEERAIPRLPPHLASKVTRLDPTQTLGRGAGLRMPAMAFAYPIAEWERVPEVQEALRDGWLRIDLTPIRADAMARARRRVEERSTRRVPPDSVEQAEVGADAQQPSGSEAV